MFGKTHYDKEGTAGLGDCFHLLLQLTIYYILVKMAILGNYYPSAAQLI